MSHKKTGGSRYLYEPFDAANARIETHEKVTAERWSALERRLNQIEGSLERLERRLWQAVYAVVGYLLSRGAFALLDYANNNGI